MLPIGHANFLSFFILQKSIIYEPHQSPLISHTGSKMGIKKWRMKTEIAEPHDDVTRSASMLQLSTRPSDFRSSINKPLRVSEWGERERERAASSSSVLHAAQHPTISESFPPSLSRTTLDDDSPQTVIDDGTWETFKVNVTSRFSKKIFFSSFNEFPWMKTRSWIEIPNEAKRNEHSEWKHFYGLKSIFPNESNLVFL